MGRLSFIPWRNDQTDERGNYNRKYDGVNHDREQQKHGKPLPPGIDGNPDEWVVIEDTFFAVVAATVPWLAKDACLTPKAEMTDGYIGT